MDEKAGLGMRFGIACMNGLYTILLVMLFWNWFVVPLGVVKISFFWAMGIYLLVNIILDGVNHVDFDHKEEQLKDLNTYKESLVILSANNCVA